jgi:hypothetical protein
MRRLFLASTMVAGFAFAMAWFAARPASLEAQAAQRGTPSTTAAAPTAVAADVPKMPDGKPDLSGVWWGGADVGPRLPRGARGPTFQSLYQPWAAEKAKTLSDKDDPTLKCIPVAFGTLNVSMYNVGAVAQIVANPKFVVMLSETFHGFQLIPTDGRRHRDDIPPAYRGDSVGRWDGDTFVVDTTNFTDDTWMSAEGRVSFHSDQLHVVERYRRINKNTLEVEATVEDPKVLTGPWTVPKQTLVLAPFDQIMALNCSGFETQAAIGAK